MKLWKVSFETGAAIVHWQKFFRTYRHALIYLHQKTEEVNRSDFFKCTPKSTLRFLVTSVNGFGRKIEDGYLSIEEIETED